MTAYLAGPMTGLPDFNYPMFAEAAETLRACGVAVLSPAELFGGQLDLRREQYLRRGIIALLGCDSVIMLPGWRESAGAMLEHDIAQAVGMSIFEWISLGAR